MGFYSIYKILKDIIKTIFGKKFLIIMLLVLLFLVGLFAYQEVQATSEVLYPVNHSSDTIDISGLIDSGLYYFMYVTKASRTYTFSIIKSDKPFIFVPASSPSQSNSGSFVSTQNCNYIVSSGETGSLASIISYVNNFTLSQSVNANQAITSFSPHSFTGYGVISYDSVVYSCNFDIKDRNGNVVFGNTTFNPPHFDNTLQSLQDLSFNYLFIDPADYGFNNFLYVHLLEVNHSITSGTDTFYYYNDVVYSLDINSPYYFNAQPTSYYSIPRYKFDFELNTQYYLVLSSSATKINSTNGIITESYDDVFQVVSIDTTSVLTQSDIDNNQMKQNTQNLKDMQDDLSNTTPTENDNEQFQEIFGHDLSNAQANQVNTSFFSRLSNMLSSFLDYDYLEDETLEFPLPHSNHVIVLHSNILSSHINNTLATIIGGFWIYIFGMYAFKFLNNLIVAIRDGEFLNFDKPIPGTVRGQVILTDML